MSRAQGHVLKELRAGRERIERGWCQNDFARDADGNAIDPKDPRACRWCVYGASFSYWAEKILENAGQAWFDSNLLAVWNDMPERTHADVLELYDRAIALAES